ncbi:MAG: NADH-quinone oxidoreductase subunit L [Phycisphaerales bacterium]
MTTILASILPSLTLAAEPAHGAGAFPTPDAIAQGPSIALLILALPLLSAVLCGVYAMLGVKTKLPAFSTVALLAVSFFLVLATWNDVGKTTALVHGFDWINFAWGDQPGQNLAANFGLYIDSLTILWMLFVTGLATLIALYASEYMSHDVGPGYCRFFAAFSLFVFSMSALVMADNLLLLYLGWEGVGLCSYLLIGYFYKKPSAVAAAKKAFIVNRIGDLGLALGVFAVFVTFGTVEYAPLFASIGQGVDGAGHSLSGSWQETWIPFLFMLAAFGKSAQLPLYVWLPDAMEGPTPVSALIHAATMVTAGVFLIARLFPMFALDDDRLALATVAWVGGLTAFFAATIGMAQFDIKRIMAYSTVSQLGYMFMGLGVLTTAGAAFHVFTHAFFKAVLFLACGAVMHGFAGQLDLRKLSGLRRVPGWQWVSLAMLIGCLNLAGFPFTAGYFSKDMVLAEAFVTHGPGFQILGVLALLTAGITAYYTFRVFFRVFVGPVEYHPGDELHAHDGDDHGHGEEHHHDAGEHGDHHSDGFHPHAPGWAINSVLIILSICAILAAGLYFVNKKDHGWVGSMVHHSSAHFVNPDAHHAPAPGAPGADAAHDGEAGGFWSDPHKWMYYASALVGFIGIAIAFVLHYMGRTTAARSKADDLLPLLGPIPRWAQNKWYVDEFYDWTIRLPLRALAHIFHLFDVLVIDGLVNFFGALPKFVGWGLRPSQNGVLQSYAAGMAGGIALFLIVVWLLL